MKRCAQNLFWIFLLVVCIRCGGDSPSQLGGVTEAGNPAPPTTPKNLRAVVAEVEEGEIGPCAAVQMIAFNTSLKRISASVNADCTFELDLAVGKVWGIYFELEGKKWSHIIRFSNGDLNKPGYYHTVGDEPIDLGLIQFDEFTPTSSENPTAQVDRDSDSISDFDDPDDDNDGILDADESDCDGDGFWDDEDLSSNCS